MKKWLVLLFSGIIVCFVVLVCVHADCSVCEIVSPVQISGVSR